ncbi:MAG: threonine--tRNA ligase, partial [Chloroflexi bacterium]|nr:threonine--tRNA ligase [Chloroflexota bacterium]
MALKPDPDLAELRKRIRHSASHVMADVVKKMFPDTKLAIGPPTDDGFYYDFLASAPFREEDLEEIERRMREVMARDLPFEYSEYSRDDSLTMNSDEPMKLEIIEGIPEDEAISTYRHGDFEDLCAGPHVESTGRIPAFKLLSVAGAYWRGDEKRPMLQRIYGTAFFNKQDLQTHLERVEEAKKRDHRKLGKELDLFTFSELVGSGLPLFTPKGTILREEINAFSQELRVKRGFKKVWTPHITKNDLYKVSGHWDKFGDELFLVKSQVTSDQLVLKPMNCPHHIKIYSSDPHSYRDLPVRLAEFGTVYRWEQSGEIGGLTRVRGFTQDDAHIFCTEEQLLDELLGCLELVKLVLGTLAITEFRVRVGMRDADDDKYVGDPKNWEKAEKACLEAAESLGVPYTQERGEAAFYGPKIDFIVNDVVGRSWQLGTVQVDYNLPERFDLSYSGEDNKPHRPVMIHRAPGGSM